LIEKCAESENWLDDVTSGAESVIVQDDASKESSHQGGQKSGESGGPWDFVGEVQLQVWGWISAWYTKTVQAWQEEDD